MLSFDRAVLLVAVSLAACGGSVANPSSQNAAGGGGAGAGGGGGVTGSPQPTAPQPPPPAPVACSTLSFSGPAQAVGDGDAQQALLASIAAEPGGVLVGMSGVTSFAYPFRVREVGFDGTPLAPGVDVFQQDGLLAAGGGHAGAVGGGTTCSFTSLGPDGTPVGKGTSFASTGCSPFVATASGFATIMHQPSASLLVADASGDVTSTVPLPTPTSLPTAMAVLPDGSFLVLETDASASNCECPTPLYSLHVGADGQALGSRVEVGNILPGTSSALAVVGNGALLVEASASVLVQPLDGGGNPVGQPTKLASPDGAGAARTVDVAAVGSDVAVVAWVEDTEAKVAPVIVQAVSITGAPLSTAVVAPASAGGPHVRVVATPAGGLVGWDGASYAVMVAPVTCGGQ